MYQHYYCPTNVEQVLELLAISGAEARVIAGGTDLILEMERGVRSPQVLIDVTRIAGLDTITKDNDDWIHFGPLVTHNQVLGSDLCIIKAYPLAMACLQVGSPQIRNRGTIAGNLITASPANDTITPLWALGARVTLTSIRGRRVVAFEDFFQDVRQTALAPDELLTDITFPAMSGNQRGIFLKLGLRQAQAIAVINLAIVLTFDEDLISHARITIGSVAPTIVRAYEAEAILIGSYLEESVIHQAAKMAASSVSPIDDIRGTADYRRHMVDVFTKRALSKLRNGTEREDWPQTTPQLWGRTKGIFPKNLNMMSHHNSKTQIVTKVNGQRYTIHGANNKTLLRMLRENIGLTGTKEGCAEGECGACTVWLDGIAVDSCMVPAPRAHGSEIVTIEGLVQKEGLHPVQQAFIDEGAVQCGYCTPGFIMSAASLLDEGVTIDQEAIRLALTGCLCRCTGYYKIFSAIEKAKLTHPFIGELK